ncbi:MAG: hypothetical protein ACT4OK_07710 [Gemmobacter sp.]
MQDDDDRLDRHALVIALWLAAGFAALVLFARGFGAGGVAWLAGGFAALLAGFALHIVANAVLRTGFTAREVALALVLAMTGLLALGLAVLAVPGFAGRFFLPLAGGAAVLVAAVMLYLVTRFGPRDVLGMFDAARDTNPRPANRLRHRGGRR